MASPRPRPTAPGTSSAPSPAAPAMRRRSRAHPSRRGSASATTGRPWRRSGTWAISAWPCAARCSRPSAKPTRRTLRAPAGRWTSRSAPCAPAGWPSGRSRPTSGAIRSPSAASARRPRASRRAAAATRTSSAACCSPARARPTPSTAMASSARTSRRCRRSLEAPLVSCIMPTSGRPDWVAQAIRYFQRQDYPNLELIIVDASPGAELAPLPDDPRILRERIRPGTSIGAMRNRACELARGEAIVHWDDDDWYAAAAHLGAGAPDPGGPRRHHRAHRHALLRAGQLAVLALRPAPAPAALRAGRARRHAGVPPLAATGARCRYPELSLAEDAWFLHQAVASGARLTRVPGADLFIYLRHAGNAWRFPCGTYLDARGWLDGRRAGAAGGRPRLLRRPLARPRRAPRRCRPRSPTPSARSPSASPCMPSPIACAPRWRRWRPTRHRASSCCCCRTVRTRRPRRRWRGWPRSASPPTDAPAGAAACLNRLAEETSADTLMLLESGAIVSPGWLERLLAALAADPRHGLASPVDQPRLEPAGHRPPLPWPNRPTSPPRPRRRTAASARRGRASRRCGTSATSAWRCAGR